MNIDYSAIGGRIKARRKAQKKTQETLAEALSVSVGYISQIERGVTKVNLETLSAIAAELDCSIVELLAGVAWDQAQYLDRELSQRWNKMNSRQRQMLLDTADVILRY